MDDFNIRAEPRSYGRKRNNGFGQNVVRVLFFFGMLIPTIIIAYRIDLVNPRQPVVIQQPAPAPQQVVVQQQPSSPPRQARSKHIERRPTTPQPQESPPAETEREPLEIRPYKGPNRETPKREMRPHELIVLDLENKVQRVEVSLKRPLRVARLTGAPNAMKPDDGSLAGGSVEVAIQGPHEVLLTISTNERNQIIIVPTVKTDDGKTIAFTSKTIDPLLRRMMKTGKRAVGEIEAMKAERVRINAWLDSSLVKPLADVRAATARSNELDVLINEAEPTIQAMEAQAKIVSELAEFAKQLHGNAELRIESMAAEPPK